jgi:hypothetical protein
MNESSNHMPSLSNLDEFKPWLTDLLRSSVVVVGFDKVNGEFRNMACTLQESQIPETQRPKPLAEGATPRKVSEESLRVFDINKQEWRAFRWDKVRCVSIDLGNSAVEEFEKPVDTTSTIE